LTFPVLYVPTPCNVTKNLNGGATINGGASVNGTLIATAAVIGGINVAPAILLYNLLWQV